VLVAWLKSLATELVFHLPNWPRLGGKSSCNAPAAPIED